LSPVKKKEKYAIEAVYFYTNFPIENGILGAEELARNAIETTAQKPCDTELKTKQNSRV
jgi:hypothetical protein